MTGTKILGGTIAICAICILVLAWKCRQQSQTINAYGQILSTERNFIEVRDQIQDLKYKEILLLQSVGYDISKTGIRQDNSPLRVYLRLHDGICANCYINSIIDMYTALSGTVPVSIIGSYPYRSTLTDMLRDHKLTDTDLMNDISLLNSIPADSANSPYIFTLNDRGAVNSLLFLDKSVMNRERMNAYIRTLVNER